MFYLGNLKKLLKNMSSTQSNIDNLRFALFLAFMCATYKAVLCIFRRIVKDDRINAPIAGFFAGLFILLDTKKRREFLMVLMLARMSDTACKLIVDHKISPVIPKLDLISWFITNCALQYCCGCETDILNKGHLKFQMKWAIFTEGDLWLQKANFNTVKRRLEARL